MHAAALVEARGLVVQYGATRAVDGVDLTLQSGAIHAIVGENGAGKSTLLRAIARAVHPTAGTIAVDASARVAWVPQETLLPPDLRVADWIFLGCELRGRARWLRDKAMRDAAVAALRAIGCAAEPGARLGSLPLPQRKQVQLARALRAAPDVLLLDEPTAVLGEVETRDLFSAVRTLRQRGSAVLYVSHRIPEVLAIADRVTVLRDGRHVSTDPVHAVDAGTLVRRMVGRDVPEHRRPNRRAGEPVLRLLGATTAQVRNLSLMVRRGEIVGLAGLVGAGRSAVLEAVAGLHAVQAGQIDCAVPRAFVPEDRGSKGLVATLSVRENVCLPAAGWFVSTTRERAETHRWIDRLHIRAAGTEAAIDSLSGGNQQKVLLARALRDHPQLLLLDEPTAGVDIGAKADIHDLICRYADGGAAILLASSDLPELLALCDRIVALRAGAAVAEVAANVSEEQLAALITGADV